MGCLWSAVAVVALSASSPVNVYTPLPEVSPNDRGRVYTFERTEEDLIARGLLGSELRYEVTTLEGKLYKYSKSLSGKYGIRTRSGDVYGLRGNALDDMDIAPGGWVRVAGRMGRTFYPGGIPGNQSCWPRQWILYIEVAEIEQLPGGRFYPLLPYVLPVTGLAVAGVVFGLGFWRWGRKRARTAAA